MVGQPPPPPPRKKEEKDLQKDIYFHFFRIIQPSRMRSFISNCLSPLVTQLVARPFAGINPVERVVAGLALDIKTRAGSAGHLYLGIGSSAHRVLFGIWGRIGT